jgi:signal transduction histidine kinase
MQLPLNLTERQNWGHETKVIRLSDSLHRNRAAGSSDEARAYVRRMMSFSELTASIAHEVNQPLTGIAINGEACLRFPGTKQMGFSFDINQLPGPNGRSAGSIS